MLDSILEYLGFYKMVGDLERWNQFFDTIASLGPNLT